MMLAQTGAGDEQTEEAPVARLTKLPQLIEYVEAPYPAEAQEAGTTGTVVLALDVDETGLVQRVEVLAPAGHGFDAAAMQAAAGFVFSPAEAGELGPVPVRITYRYSFILEPVLVATSTPTATATETDTVADQPVLPINLMGTVREMGTRAPVAFATVSVEQVTTATDTDTFVVTSTESDSAGRFALRGVPTGRTRIRITAPFFRPQAVIETIGERDVLEVVYFVARAKRNPYEVVVRAKVQRKEVARRTLRMEEIKRVPGTQGDAIRVVQNMPGVARTPFGLGLLVVRGAPPQDTGGFIDGHRIPLLFHFGGIGGVTSVVNSRMLEQIDFYPGGFGPDYGLVSAGVVDMKTRAARSDRVHGEAQINTIAFVPADVGVFVEGPLTDDPDHGAFVFSLRRSAVDGVFALLTSLTDSAVQLAPRYYDYSLRYDVPVGDSRRTATLLAYGSDDELILLGAGALSGNEGGADTTQTRTMFHRINPRFTYRADDDTLFEISPIFGVDFTNIEAPQSSGSGSVLRIRATNFSAGLRLSGETRLTDWLSAKLGGELQFLQFNSDSEVPAFTPVRDFPSPVATDAPTRKDSVTIPVIAPALFGELHLEPFEGLSIWPGVRVQALDYKAEDHPLIDKRLVDGRTLATVDPRVTARYSPFDFLAFKGQAGLYSQPALPNQIFLNADLPMQRVQQYSLGVEWQIIDKLLLDIQGFYRKGEDIARATGATTVVDGRIRPVGFRPDGESRAFGMEVLLRLEKRWGLFGWIAYTLSRSETRRLSCTEAGRDDCDTPDTSGQDWRANFYFDQTHNLNIVAVYELGLDWHFGLRFRFVTGGGLPKVDRRWYDADLDGYRPSYGEIDRAPSFHQLDLYVEKKFRFDQWSFETYFDLQNVYNHENTEFFAPTFDYKDVVPIPGLPIFPAFGIKGEF